MTSSRFGDRRVNTVTVGVLRLMPMVFVTVECASWRIQTQLKESNSSVQKALHGHSRESQIHEI